jgi:hypothetical protein
MISKRALLASAAAVALALQVVGCGDSRKPHDETSFDASASGDRDAEQLGGDASATGEDGSGPDAGPQDADAGADGGVQESGLELIGRWHRSTGGEETIEEERWERERELRIVTHDNVENTLITQNPADAADAPNGFNKVVWTERSFEDSFYYCEVVEGLSSIDEALAFVGRAEATKPSSAGCGEADGPWVELKRAIEIGGDYTSNFGYSETIDSDSFNRSAVIAYDNRANYMITQSPLDDEYTPGQFAKLVWTEQGADGFWYCTVEFGLPDAEAARATTKPFDASRREEGGCGEFDFPWTHLKPVGSP